MDYRIYIYTFMLLLTAFALSGINFDNFFKKNHIIEAKIIILLLAMSISYLTSEFIISFIDFI